MTTDILMSNDAIVKFVRENNISAIDLKVAAHTMTCEDIVAKIENLPNKEYVFNDKDGCFYPRVICTAFDEVEEVALERAYIDQDGTLRFEVCSYNSGETYDVAHAELDGLEFVEEMIIVK
jgi:hypothetical protein